MAITKEQAEALLRAYIEKQTAATEAAIAAHDRETDETVKQTERAAEADRREALTEERAQYSKAAVQAMIDRYAVAQTLAKLGLSRSGTADAMGEAVTVRRTVAERQASDKRARALSALSERLLTAREQAAAKKEKNAAAARRTLAGKIAEKTVTLNRAAIGG